MSRLSKTKPRKTVDQQQKYERWWLGKCVRWPFENEVKRVCKVRFIGPPSGVYGGVELSFDDGSSRMVASTGFKPRKCEIIVVR